MSPWATLWARGVAALAIAALLALVACGPAGPRPIAYGKQACANCLMTVSDDRFGAELVTRTGKVYVFDSPECLAEFVGVHPAEAAGSLWVTDFTRPGTLIPAEGSQFVRTTSVSSPMGLGVAAVEAGRQVPPGLTGPPLPWAQVVALAGRRPGSDPGHAVTGAVAGAAPAIELRTGEDAAAR